MCKMIEVDPFHGEICTATTQVLHLAVIDAPPSPLTVLC